jgi:hypothetical protein
MLPFRVIQLEQHRALQQDAATLYLPASSLLTGLLPEQNFETRSCRLPGSLSPGDLAVTNTQNTEIFQGENERVLQSGCSTSNRLLGKNRCYRKQTIKPCLTGAGMRFREFQECPKMDPIFGLFFAPISGAKSRGIA